MVHIKHDQVFLAQSKKTITFNYNEHQPLVKLFLYSQCFFKRNDGNSI